MRYDLHQHRRFRPLVVAVSGFLFVLGFAGAGDDAVGWLAWLNIEWVRWVVLSLASFSAIGFIFYDDLLHRISPIRFEATPFVEYSNSYDHLLIGLQVRNISARPIRAAAAKMTDCWSRDGFSCGAGHLKWCEDQPGISDGGYSIDIPARPSARRLVLGKIHDKSPAAIHLAPDTPNQFYLSGPLHLGGNVVVLLESVAGDSRPLTTTSRLAMEALNIERRNGCIVSTLKITFGAATKTATMSYLDHERYEITPPTANTPTSPLESSPASRPEK